MPLMSAPLGVSTPVIVNQVLALPSSFVCFVFSSAALESSPDGTTWSALTGANTTGVNCGFPFVRCPGGPATIIVKKA